MKKKNEPKKKIGIDLTLQTEKELKEFCKRERVFINSFVEEAIKDKLKR